MMYLLFLHRPQQPPPTAPQPPPPAAAIQRPRRRHNMLVRPWLLQREERRAYHNITAELYATDIPGFTNYMRMTPEFFEMIKTRLEPRLARQATNYRAPISVGEKLALTIRYLATGESYTSLSCQFRVGRCIIPEVCRAIQDEFSREYLRCPTTPEEFRIRWNVPHALGALDGKHVAVKKLKNTGALFHNYKGFFFIVMLALVDGQYKFRWVDAGTAGSCSDAQIFNASQLKRRIEDVRIGFPDPAPITQGGRDVPYFILADDAFALKTWLMKPYGRRMLIREEMIANYRISRGRRVVENAFRAPISVGKKLALTIRYLATGESYTSLSCQFRVDRSTISKFLPEVCRAIQDEFSRKYLRCPTTPEEWEELEREFRIKWNVPHALGGLDGKHVAVKKPKNTGALFHNNKGFVFIVMLALVDGQYKFRWVDAGTAGSCSDAQIFNASQLKRRIP